MLSSAKYEFGYFFRRSTVTSNNNNNFRLSTFQVVDSDCGWIKFPAEEFSVQSTAKYPNAGMWIIELPNGKEYLDAVWNQLVEGVESGKIWKIKASAIDTKRFNTQVIYIYTQDSNNENDVCKVYEYLFEKNIVAGHCAENNNVMLYKSANFSRINIQDVPSKIYSNSTMQNLLNNTQIIKHFLAEAKSVISPESYDAFEKSFEGKYFNDEEFVRFASVLIKNVRGFISFKFQDDNSKAEKLIKYLGEIITEKQSQIDQQKCESNEYRISNNS